VGDAIAPLAAGNPTDHHGPWAARLALPLLPAEDGRDGGDTWSEGRRLEREAVTSDKVRVYDLETGKLTTIPVRELAPGMIRASVEGIEGDVWVDAKQAKSSPEYRHPPFDQDTRDVLVRLEQVFHDVYPCSLDKCEDAFRRDANPDKEILLWLRMGYAFDHFTKGRRLNAEQRMDIFSVINAAMNVGKDKVHFVVAPRTLSKRRVTRSRISFSRIPAKRRLWHSCRAPDPRTFQYEVCTLIRPSGRRRGRLGETLLVRGTGLADDGRRVVDRLGGAARSEDSAGEHVEEHGGDGGADGRHEQGLGEAVERHGRPVEAQHLSSKQGEE
jgi:hypothetical protein